MEEWPQYPDQDELTDRGTPLQMFDDAIFRSMIMRSYVADMEDWLHGGVHTQGSQAILDLAQASAANNDLYIDTVAEMLGYDPKDPWHDGIIILAARYRPRLFGAET